MSNITKPKLPGKRQRTKAEEAGGNPNDRLTNTIYMMRKFWIILDRKRGPMSRGDYIASQLDTMPEMCYATVTTPGDGVEPTKP